MIIDHVKIAKGIEKFKGSFTLKEPFDAISLPNNDEIECCILIAIKASADEIGRKKHLKIEIVAEKEGGNKVLEIADEQYTIENQLTALVLDLNPLPLIGAGSYALRIMEMTETPSVLFFATILRVDSIQLFQKPLQAVYA